MTSVFIKFVPTSQETHCFSVTKVNRLTVSREAFAVYSENHMKHINAQCGQKAGFMSTKAGEIEIKLPLCLIKTYGTVEVYIHVFLNPTLRRRLALSFIPRLLNVLYLLGRRLVGPQSRSGRCEENNHLCPAGI
jgi:hypothetical protein